MNIKRWESLLLVVIILIAFFLRFYRLGEIPGSLNPDEVAQGYTSYSLLKTGMDEHGKFLPLALQSFGDWKLPVYSYIGVFSVALFGLTEVSVRLTSVAAGVMGVALIYFICLLLFNRRKVAFFSALFFALSPWSIYFSRAAYEVNLATAFFLGGLLAYLTYLFEKKKNVKILFIAFILFGLTLFTQHNYILFTPIFIIVTVVLLRKNITFDKSVLLAIMIFIVFVLLSYVSVAFGGIKKISNLNLFNDKNIIYNRVEKLRGDNANKNLLLERILHTRYIGVPYQIGQNYINSLSPNFLFDKGGEKLVHNIGDIGFFYLFDAVLIFIGFVGLFWNKHKSLMVILPWLFIAPLPSAITRDSPNATRLFTIMPALIIVSSYGAYQIVSFFRKIKPKFWIFGIMILMLFALNVFYFLEYYLIHFNNHRVRFWRYGYRETAKLTMEYPEYNVVMRGPENFPYIYFLFYEKYDPVKFISEARYYSPTHEGFYYVKKFGRYEFVDSINYSNLKKNTIYIDDAVGDDKKNSILLPSGEPVLVYHIIGEKSEK